MTDPKRIEAAQNWMRLAAEDLESAEHMPHNLSGRFRNVCFFAQQAAEKAIKAALALEAVPFPFLHDLDELRELLPDGWDVHEVTLHLHDLTEWAVRGRYADPRELPAESDAIHALDLARTVFQSIKREFDRRGIALADPTPP